ncbi:MAG: LCP family protein, partial [Actinomycetota bacterium]
METTPSEPSMSAPHPYRPRHTFIQRAVLALNIVVVIACLVGAGALLYGKNELDGRLQTEKADVQTSVATTASAGTADPSGGPTQSSGPPETFPVADPQAQNFLVTGSDANACADKNSPWAGATYGRASFGSRSDTIMVMRVDPATRAAAVLSFPRDLWVKIPGKGKSRINSAYVKDDYSLLAQTLYDNFGIKVDHYIQVDFCAFKRIVDAVGGVAVPFNTPVVDLNVGLQIYPTAGQTAPFCHSFGGDEALAYVRSRHLKSVDASGKTHEDTAADLGRI